jgi:hypothetical protein
MENSNTAPETDKSATKGWHDLSRKDKLTFIFLIPIILAGLLSLIATVGLLVASYFASIPRVAWLVCFAASGTVFAVLLAEPYLRLFIFGGDWMVFRNNVIYFWLLMLSVAVATFRTFASPIRYVILIVLVALLTLDGVLGLGYVRSSRFFLKRRNLKPPLHS